MKRLILLLIPMAWFIGCAKPRESTDSNTNPGVIDYLAEKVKPIKIGPTWTCSDDTYILFSSVPEINGKHTLYCISMKSIAQQELDEVYDAEGARKGEK